MSQSPSTLLTVSEVATELRVDDTTVRRWIKSGVLEAIPLPARGPRQAWRVKRETVDALLTSTNMVSSTHTTEELHV